jgi:hypothetical protein
VWAGGGMHLEAGFDWSVMCRLLALFGHAAMSDLSPLSGVKRKFANVSGLDSLPSEICAMSTNAHSKNGARPNSQTKGTLPCIVGLTLLHTSSMTSGFFWRPLIDTGQARSGAFEAGCQRVFVC